MIATLEASALIAELSNHDSPAEIAILDAREQGVYFDSHLFHAASVPLSQLELMLPRLVPRRTTRIVWCDDGTSTTASAPEGLAVAAAQRAVELGWTNVSVLSGGTAAWAQAGGELYSGVNVPSKAFGEFVEHEYGTPRMPAAEVKALIDAKADMVILDSRPMPEFTNMSIPTGTDCPGAELVHRVKEMAPSHDTLVVVNCAGRTRSIIGCQSLVNAGLENRVVALENGTMGWELAGYEVARGHTTHAPDPSPSSQEWSQAAAASVGKRFGVVSVDHDQVAAWQADADRTTYLLDVRTPEEFAAGHLPGSVSAPGGQLVQATDEYVATWNARLVLIDDDGVRATMTASWLRQLGWDDAVVLDDVVLDAVVLDDVVLDAASSAQELATESVRAARVDGTPLPEVALISVADLAARLDAGDVTVLDLGTSLKYRKKGHISGAWWGVRSRLDEARETMGAASTVVLTSSDSLVASLAAPEAAQAWPDAEILVLEGGNRAWNHAGHPMEPGFTNPTTEANDVWYKPYDHDDGVPAEHMQNYLTWEIALVDQLDRDPTVFFPTFAEG